MSYALEAADLRQQIKALLLQTIKVELLDGRFVTGRFECFDSDRNVILSSAEEKAPIESCSGDTYVQYDTRRLGLVMVPGSKIRKIFRRSPTATAESSSFMSCII
mmetsp:Transcript_1537/g.4104  ORF Transcript_1537/g.4104 Transcript_1537/m.4104 type:complete len:105 (-) Transcript_1537:611-925(-)